ncbi:MAG: ester cyclase [Ginsengibacter sp.]
MKKFFCLTGISVLLFLMSCTDSATKTNTGTTVTSESERNKANNRAVMKAIETGDSTVIDTLIASDAVDHAGPHMTEIKGDSIKMMLGNMHNDVSDLKMDIIADAAEGDYVFTLSRMTGTTANTAMGMPANTKMDMTGVDVVKFKDGKAVEHWSYMDPKDMMKMMPSGEDKMMGNKMKDTMMKK